MALYLAREIKWEIEAKVSQLVIEYDPKPMSNSGNYQTAKQNTIDNAESILVNTPRKGLSLKEFVRYRKTLLKLKKNI